ncbi:MAG: Hsp70 family protein [Bdellovibrionales bacterium]
MFLGIDLGTSNSVVCGIVDGQLRLFKTSDGGDTLPSAIYVDKRGSRLYGRRALEQSLLNPDSVATGFKRLMGTATPIELPGAGVKLTPEECSGDIIKQLLGQATTETGKSEFQQVVITIPAAFNQMQSEATLRAAERAGLTSVKLLQEPVAAAIAAAQGNVTDGQYLIYDLGGGTFDLALARAEKGDIKIVANQGINMLGGRDLDRKIVQEIIHPWLYENFALPDGFARDAKYKRLQRVCLLAAEKAKIDLSSRDNTSIFASDDEVRTEDTKGNPIFLDVRLQRAEFEKLIGDTVARTITVAQQLLEDQGLKAGDINRLVFIGGPSKIPLVRSRVSRELGIEADLSLDPLTTVAAGAAYYAAHQAGATVTITTTQTVGSNKIEEAKPADVVEKKVAQTITIPAAKTIAIKVRQGEGDDAQNILVPILEAGIPLPAQGEANFVAAESLTASMPGYLSFEIFQLEFPERLELNLCVGAFRLGAEDLPAGTNVVIGDKIVFKWHMNDSGILTATVKLPTAELPTPRFYAPQEGERSYAGDTAIAFADAVLTQGEEELSDVVAAIGPMGTRELDLLKHRLAEQRSTLGEANGDPELLRQVSEEARFIRQDIARLARKYAASVLQRRLGKMVAAFNRVARGFATIDEVTEFEAGVRAVQDIIATSAAQRADALKENNIGVMKDGGVSSADWYKAERKLTELRRIFFASAWRDTIYVQNWYERVKREAYLFPDAEEYAELLQEAEKAMTGDDSSKLQAVMNKILTARITLGASDSTADLASIAQG